MAEGNGLLNRRRVTPTAGSNPALSAIFFYNLAPCDLHYSLTNFISPLPLTNPIRYRSERMMSLSYTRIFFSKLHA